MSAPLTNLILILILGRLIWTDFKSMQLEIVPIGLLAGISVSELVCNFQGLFPFLLSQLPLIIVFNSALLVFYIKKIKMNHIIGTGDWVLLFCLGAGSSFSDAILTFYLALFISILFIFYLSLKRVPVNKIPFGAMLGIGWIVVLLKSFY